MRKMKERNKKRKRRRRRETNKTKKNKKEGHIANCCIKNFFRINETLIKLTWKGRSRDSSVGIATGYGLDDQGEREFESR
jgi:hypothetical protein